MTAIAYPEEEINIVSDKEYFYRNKMEFIFHERIIGLRKKGNPNIIVHINHCVIAEEAINNLLKETQAFFKNIDTYNKKRKNGTFVSVTLRTSKTEQGICFMLYENSSKLAEAIELIKKYAQDSSAQNIMIAYVTDKEEIIEPFVVKGNDYLTVTYLGKTFQYSLLGFFQNNHAMAEKMHEYVHKLLSNYPTQQSHLLDLYSGVGTFGIINADLFKTVNMIESFEQSVVSAQKNIEINNTKNAKTNCINAKQLKKIEFQKPLFVITDPPRTGMDLETLQTLKKNSPEVIIYVSCDVQQLRKELKQFQEYEIKSAALFDLFPQTWHSEAVIELVKKK